MDGYFMDGSLLAEINHGLEIESESKSGSVNGIVI